MNTELRKRVEEAAGFAKELGYKVAIKVAKDCLREILADEVKIIYKEGTLVISKDAFLLRFENNMNKLWEEKK